VKCAVLFSDYIYLHRPHYNQQYCTDSIFAVRLLAVEKVTLLVHSNWWCYQLYNQPTNRRSSWGRRLAQSASQCPLVCI